MKLFYTSLFSFFLAICLNSQASITIKVSCLPEPIVLYFDEFDEPDGKNSYFDEEEGEYDTGIFWVSEDDEWHRLSIQTRWLLQ